MNVQKSEMKMMLAQDIGKQFEEREKGLWSEAHRLEGANGALKQGAEKLESLKVFYNKEVDEDRLEEKDLAGILRAIDRCQGVLINLAELAHAQKLVKQGEAQGAKTALDMIEKIYEDERTKIGNVLQAVEEGKITPEEVGRAVDGSTTLRVVDGRPAMNDAAADIQARREEARLAREKSEQAKTEPSKAEAAPAPVVPAPASPVVPAVVKREVRRRKPT